MQGHGSSNSLAYRLVGGRICHLKSNIGGEINYPTDIDKQRQKGKMALLRRVGRVYLRSLRPAIGFGGLEMGYTIGTNLVNIA